MSLLRVNGNANVVEVEGAAALLNMEPHTISDEDIQNLNTITDFDVSTGELLNEFLRVVPGDVTPSAVNLLLWLILERELHQVDMMAVKLARNNRANMIEEDNVDAANNPQPPQLPPGSFDNTDPLAGLSSRVRRRTASHSGKARKQIEDLLRSSGFGLPFHQLSVAERKMLFQQFANSSVMLPPEKYGSIPEVFHALRTRSKLREEFEVGDRLGGGNFGDVYAVTNRQSKVKYAAKRISLSLNCFEEMRMTLNESRILQSVSHENIVKCVDAWLEMKYDPRAPSEDDDEQEPLKFYVLMDFCYQSLSEWIIEVRKKPELKEMVLICKHTLAGLKFLHSNQILHFDINTRNIMWADEEKTLLKIGDFGLAIKGDSFPYPTGTPPYAAPDKVFTNKSDVYSLGVTLLEIAENIATASELIHRINDLDYRTQFPFMNNVLPIVLSKNPNVRPSAEQFQSMLNRVLNPPVRPVLELEAADYRLVGAHIHPEHVQPIIEAVNEEDNENDGVLENVENVDIGR